MNRVNNVDMPRRTIWTQGDAMSWVLGVLLGGFLGLVLLIATPIILRNAVTPAAATTPAAAPSPASTTASAPAKTETPAVSTSKPAAGGAGNVDAGKATFASATCAGCHGAQAQGGIGPALPKVVSGWTDAQFATAVREGKTPEKTLQPMMPHFTAAQVSDADLVNLHAFLKSLQ